MLGMTTHARCTTITAVLSTALLLAPSAMATKNPPPADLSFASGQTPVRVVTPDEALAAASQPGADVDLLPGITPQQATGLSPTPATSHASETEGGDTTGSTCWFASVWGEWGIYPYQQRVTDNTYWCGRGGILTYRDTYATLGSSLCTHDNGYDFRIGGAVGNFYVLLQVGGSFSCGLPWIGGYNTDRWLRTIHTAYGDAYISDHS
jgi:hypothetical protein